LTIHKYKLGHNFNHQGKSIHSNSINGYGDDKNLAKLKRLHQKEYTRNVYDVRITFSEITIIALHCTCLKIKYDLNGPKIQKRLAYFEFNQCRSVVGTNTISIN